MRTSLAFLVTPFLVCLAIALAGCASDGPGPIDLPSIADSPDADMDPVAPAFGDLDEPGPNLAGGLPSRPPAPSMQPPAYTPPAYTPPAYTAPSYSPATATGGFDVPAAPAPADYSAPAPSDAPSSCGGGGGG